jgi:hypothetical protein
MGKVLVLNFFSHTSAESGRVLYDSVVVAGGLSHKGEKYLKESAGLASGGGTTAVAHPQDSARGIQMAETERVYSLPRQVEHLMATLSKMYAQDGEPGSTAS